VEASPGQALEVKSPGPSARVDGYLCPARGGPGADTVHVSGRASWAWR